jgi:hypothetical protein
MDDAFDGLVLVPGLHREGLRTTLNTQLSKCMTRLGGGWVMDE